MVEEGKKYHQITVNIKDVKITSIINTLDDGKSTVI